MRIPALLAGLALGACGLTEAEVMHDNTIGRANVNKACVIACHSEVNVCPAPPPAPSPKPRRARHVRS